MFFISAVPVGESHCFIYCSARHIPTAKAMATRLVHQPGMKAAVAFAPSLSSQPVPLAEIVYRPGCAWQSLLPNLHPVALHHD